MTKRNLFGLNNSVSSDFSSNIENALEQIEKETQRIEIWLEERSYGKVVTVISGIENDKTKDMLKQLKQKLGCGGTVKDNIIELQGNHIEKVKKFLIENGYKEENIEFKGKR